MRILNISFHSSIWQLAFLCVGLVACAPDSDDVYQMIEDTSMDSISLVNENSNLQFSTSADQFADGSRLEVGGSNYVLFDATEYIKNPSDATWYQKDALKPVIGSYDLNPRLVRSQLQAMCNAGQKKIALMLWYMPMSNEQNPTGVYGHVVNSLGGKLTPRHEKNLRDFLSVMSSLRKSYSYNFCFNELQFRFAPQGAAEAGGWRSWDEKQYQENWSFIVNTRSIVESVMSQSQTRRLYDLSVEAGGLTNGQNRSYVKRLWQDYVYTFGRDDTYGFSIALAPGRVAELIRTYSDTGVRPNSYALDIYDDVSNLLRSVSAELDKYGEKNKALLIQEAYYNEKSVADEFVMARRNYNLKIRTIMQWPRSLGSAIPHFSMNSTPDYSNYLSLADVAPVPAAPVATAASFISDTGFKAHWTAVSGATAYYLDVSTSSSFNSFVSGYYDLNVGASLTKTLVGLPSKTTYFYRVRVQKGTEFSGNSNAIGVITIAGKVFSTGGLLLRPNQFVETATVKLIYQSDANLVIYSKIFNKSLWSIGIFDAKKCVLKKCFVQFQTDGNLVAYDDNGVAYWSTNTYGSNYKLILVDTNPYLRIEGAGGGIKWKSQ